MTDKQADRMISRLGSIFLWVGTGIVGFSTMWGLGAAWRSEPLPWQALSSGFLCVIAGCSLMLVSFAVEWAVYREELRPPLDARIAKETKAP